MLTIDGEPVTVHALPTGTITIKHCHHDLCVDEGESYERRFFSLLRDREFAEPMPIWTYVIEHPQGVFVVDTGADTEFRDRESWACDRMSGRIARSMAWIDIREEEPLLSRLAAIGKTPRDVEAAVITHLHFDHTSGIEDLGVPTYVGAGDVEAGRSIGSTACRQFPTAELIEVEPELSDLQPRDEPGDRALGPSLPLTNDGALRVYSTPGHTPGSLTIRLETDQGDLWFIGDTSFDERNLGPGEPTASIHVLMPETRALQLELAAFRDAGALLLPSHDADAGTRLAGFH